MKKLLSILLICSMGFSEEVPCDGTCLSETETKNIYNNIQELQFDLDKSNNLNLTYKSLMKDYETQIKLKEDMIDLVKPKWYDNKYLWFFGGVILTSSSIYLAGQID